MADQLERLKAALADRYSVEHPIGAGGMATVFLAEDRKHHRDVAIKVLHPELAAGIGPDRFLREIQIAASLAHPHIVTLIDSGEAGGFLYYVMPRIEGESLRERLKRAGSLSVGESLRILQDVVDALAHAHARGVVHRDIKPGNILLSGQHALVTDFGVAKALSEAATSKTLTTAGLSIGTPAYTSPEQAAADPNVDHRADIYSVGVVAYELLTGRPPFVDRMPHAILSAQVTKTPDPVRKHQPTVPPAVEQMVMKCLEKDPADRWQSAEELSARLDALTTPTEGITPTDAPQPAMAILGGKHRVALAAVLVLAAALTILFLRSRARPQLDSNVLAVAPFDVLGPELETWREGLVDMLSASLDGAGPLRTVSPSAVIKGWEGRAEATSADRLGRGTGAGLVVYGRLVAAGEDSARASATLYDALDQEMIAEFALRDRIDRVDRLADSLAVRVMAALSQDRPLGVWHLASLGSSSPAALKEFLHGEQHYRRFELDSAQLHYQRAIELDSTFALAHNRKAYTIGWSLHGDPEYLPSLLRAGALNQGLARRESLLVVADSLGGAMGSFVGDSASWRRLRRIVTTLEYAVQEYPLDPQVWYKLGEARYHRPYIGGTREKTLEAFARAVELDSAFVPAYKHLVELTLLLEGPEAARQVLDAYLARAGGGEFTEAEQVARSLLAATDLDAPEIRHLVDGLSEEGLYQVWFDLKWWPDSAETAVRVAEVWARNRDTLGPRFSLAQTLAYRGHLQAARDLAGTRLASIYAEIARLGGVPEDSARMVFQQWLNDRFWSGIYGALPSWTRARDTVSLRRALAWWDSLRTTGSSPDTAVAGYFAKAARAHLSLARGDTAAALEQFATLLPWLCYSCYHEQLMWAQLLVAVGQDVEAVAVLDRMPFHLQQAPPAEAVIVALERGRVHERLGNREAAIQAFSFVMDAWRSADAELEPFVREARDGIARLSGEPPPQR